MHFIPYKSQVLAFSSKNKKKTLSFKTLISLRFIAVCP